MTANDKTSGILVIDDDSIVRAIVRACLAAIGQDVYLAASGAEALALATRMTPTLVICDINLPLMNGLKICELLRSMPLYRSIPIVMLTQHSDERTREAAKKVGATAFLSKPFRPIDILSLVAQYLPIKPELVARIRRDNERATSIANRVPGSSTAGVPITDSGLGPNPSLLRHGRDSLTDIA